MVANTAPPGMVVSTRRTPGQDRTPGAGPDRSQFRSQFRPDDSSALLEKYLDPDGTGTRNPDRVQTITPFLTRNGLTPRNLTRFLSGDEFAAKRRELVRELGLPGAGPDRSQFRSKFRPDDSSALLEKYLDPDGTGTRNPDRVQTITPFLTRNGLTPRNLTSFLSGDEFAAKRRELVRELGLPGARPDRSQFRSKLRPDDSSALLEKYLDPDGTGTRNPDRVQTITPFLTRNGLTPRNLTSFLSGEEFAAKRRELVRELGLR